MLQHQEEVIVRTRGQGLHEVTEAVAEAAPDSRLVVHTRPDNYKYLGLILRALPSAKVLYCRRAALDNCLRIYFKLYRSGNEYAYDLRSIAAFHDAYGDLMRHCIAVDVR